jgi:OOP family OmpA-OmpF porin
MNSKELIKICSLLITATTLAGISGCANYEVNSKRGDIPGYYIRKELQEADRAVEAARQAGKDKQCADAFKAAEDAKTNAYDVFRACRTEEGAALAKEATAKANALCPPQPVVQAAPVPEPAPAPPAPTGSITVTPPVITKGESATLQWTSKNATGCDIQPGIGPVKPQGSLPISPAAKTDFTLVCKGDGGTANSGTSIAVVVPPPVVAPPKPAPPAKLCSPSILTVKFDTDKADIKPQYHGELKTVADFLVEFPKAKGVIEGHTDSVGGPEYNRKLSQRRADSVRNYIIKNFGIAAERIGAKGYGLTKPVADNKTAEGRQQNRRIEANFSCN